MDTVTHGIVGALIGKAFFADDPGPTSPGWTQRPVTPGRVAILAATAGAIFPDIDVFFARFSHNQLFYLTHHRGITHSLVMLPVFAIALAAITYGLARRFAWPTPTFRTLLAIYAIAIGSHIFLDLITSFGIMIWSPISHERLAWDWILIVDLLFTLLALLPQLAAWAFHKPKIAALRAIPLWILCCAAAVALGALLNSMGITIPGIALVAVCLGMAIFLVLPLRHGLGPRLRRGRWTRVGIALISTYLAFAALLHRSALSSISQFAQTNRLQAESVAALPMPPWLLRWSGLISTAQGYYRLEFNEYGTDPVGIQFFRNPIENPYIAKARTLPDVQTFLWFARFPYFEYSVENGQSVVRVIDLRFLSDELRARSQNRGGMPATIFSYQVVFSSDGRIVSAGLVRPR